MRIKSLLFCLLAVCTISLSSCKQKDGEEDRNYADDFKGTYTMSMTPSISLSAPVLGEMEAPIEPVDGLKCSITGTIKNKAVVTLLKDNTPLFVFNGNCDENGMHLSSYNIAQDNLDLGGEYGEVSLDVTFGSVTVKAPVNGAISWTTSLTGTVGMEVEVTTGVVLPVEAELSGNLNFSGVKQ